MTPERTTDVALETASTTPKKTADAVLKMTDVAQEMASAILKRTNMVPETPEMKTGVPLKAGGTAPKKMTGMVPDLKSKSPMICVISD